jgi:hypothetical protein
MTTLLSIFLPALLVMLFGIHKSRAQTDFFRMSREASPTQYRDTTVAFSLQVAVTVYFMYWGYKYGWSNVFYIVAWYSGLFFFYKAVPLLAPAVTLHETMFEFLESRTKRHVRYVLSILSVSTLIGLIYIELFWASTYAASSTKVELGADYAAAWFWLTFFGLSLCTLLYTTIGGIRKVVQTDTIQLAAAYIGSALVFLMLFYVLFLRGRVGLLSIAVPTVAVYLGIAFCSGKSFRGASVAAHFAWVVLLITASALAYLSPPESFSDANLPNGLLSQVKEPFGWVTLLGFTLANAIWQFSDYTAFHRLTLLRLPRDQDAKLERLREAIRATMISSPLTWGIGIFLGMGIRSSALLPEDTTEVFVAFTERLAEGSMEGSIMFRLALIGFGVFISSVLISTMDSSFISVTQIMEVDVLGKQVGNTGRILILAGVFAVLMGLLVLHRTFEIDVLVFLAGFYSLFLACGSLMIRSLRVTRVGAVGASLSLVCSALGGLYVVVFPPDVHYNVLLVLPMIVAILVSTTILVLSELLSKRV